MTATRITLSGAIVCLAYLVGLLLTKLPGSVGSLPLAAIGLWLLGVLCAAIVPRRWRGVKGRVWLVAGLVGGLAACYMQWRVPHPTATDISWQIQPDQFLSATVTGTIDSTPRLTRSQKIQFQLQVQAFDPEPEVSHSSGSPSGSSSGASSGSSSSATAADQTPPPTPTLVTTGNLYVTVPLLQGTGLYPGQQVAIQGALYKPKPASHPGGFDFQSYLAQQGIFAGLAGRTVELLPPAPSPPLFWQIRQRIVRSQVRALGVPEGVLVTAMVMGRNGVDIPYEVQDQFAKAGLSHVLAASGFQVSLLVGVVVAIMRGWKPWLRFAAGTALVGFYVGLTGAEAPSVRAGLMGVAVLLGLTLERRTKPLMALLGVATAMLLIYPLWVFNLGFQMSFLATLGLLVTVPVLTRWLDWLPAAIAPLIAVPVAAYLWLLPLLLFAFGLVSPYSILINIITAPLITLISLGGMVSALAALLYPPMGTGLAIVLHYPTAGFLGLVAWGATLPGSSVAVGTLSLLQLLMLYGLFLGIWVWRRGQAYWWALATVAIALVVVPVGLTAFHRQQVTVLPASGTPIPMLVWHDRQQVTVVNPGDESDVQFTLLPFLRRSGVNQIDWAIVTDVQPQISPSWQRLQAELPIQTLWGIPAAQATPSTVPVSTSVSTATTEDASPRGDRPLIQPLMQHTPLALGRGSATVISTEPLLLDLTFATQHWLLLQTTPSSSAIPPANLAPTDVLWWSGDPIAPAWLEVLQPRVAISGGRSLPPELDTWFRQHQVEVYVPEQDGALRWTPEQGFTALQAEAGAIDWF